MATKDEILDRTTLSDLISGEGVDLKKKGREFSGCCPFHEEKTPSFTVNDEKGFYHCFGCGAHGDAITFLGETKNMEFIEAMEFLADRVNEKFEAKGKRSKNKGSKEDAGRVLTDLVDVGTTQLNAMRGKAVAAGKPPPLEYLSNEQITAMKLGWLPKTPSELLRSGDGFPYILQSLRLTGKGAPEKALVIPAISASGMLQGIYSYNGTKHPTWHGGAGNGSHLLSPHALDSQAKDRESSRLWLTDDLSLYLLLAGQDKHACALPWPMDAYQAEKSARYAMSGWKEVVLILSRQTASLYDHPLLQGVMKHHDTGTLVAATTTKTGVLPNMTDLLPLSEFLIARTESDAQIHVKGAEKRVRQIADYWLNTLPDGLYRFVMGQRVNDVIERLPEPTQMMSRLLHPLCWDPSLRRAALNAKARKSLDTSIQDAGHESALIARIARGESLNPHEHGVLFALERYEKARGLACSNKVRPN